MLTMQRVALDSKEGRKFLRRVVRDQNESSYDERWSARASVETDWQFMFTRKVVGPIGDADQYVEVQTDIPCRCTHQGGTKRSFSDADEVQTVTPRRVWIDGGSAAIVAKLALDGWRFRVEVSSGSTISSRLGLAFYSLEASTPSICYASLTIGGETITANGRTITSGAIEH